MKTLIGNNDSFELEPFAQPWAWDMARECENNNWTPEEIPVSADVSTYRNLIHTSPDSPALHIFEGVMAQLTTFDIQRGDDAVETLLPLMTLGEIRHFLKRMGWEESLHCYEAGTEILTSCGWEDFKNLTPFTEVAQVTDAGRIDWVLPQELVEDDFDGDLIEFSNKAMKSSVTPNHRVISFMRTTGYKKVERADETKLSNRHWPVAATVREKTDPPLAAVDRVKIAFQADGHKQYNKAVFRFKKKRKIRRLEALLQEAKISYTKTVRPSDPNITEFRCEAFAFPMHKEFDEWLDLRNMTQNEARDFIEELLHWDGSVSPNNVKRYWTSSQRNVDVVQAVAVLAGYHARTPKRQFGQPIQVTLVDKAWINPETLTRKAKPYKGKVYCVAVPTGTIVVRYKGHVLISGNTRSYRYVIENLGIPVRGPESLYNRWKQVPIMKARVDMGIRYTEKLEDLLAKKIMNRRNPRFTWTREDKQIMLESMIFWFLIFEGVWFWLNLCGPIQNLARQKLFVGAAEQFQFIARDESQHIRFGTQLINTFIRENPTIMDKAFISHITQLFYKGIELEASYGDWLMSAGGILGYNAADHAETSKFFANLRCHSIGLPLPFADAKHRFPWMSEQMLIKKEKNFFEQRVTEYQGAGALEWD